MIQKKTKQNSKEKKIKNDTKSKKETSTKKTISNLNSKNISNKSKTKKITSKAKLNPKSKKDIVLRRSSGRVEKFDTDRLTKTVSRSGVSFPVAKDVAKSITKKIKKSVQDTPKSTDATKREKPQRQRQQPSSQQRRQQKQQQSSVATKKSSNIVPRKEESEKVVVTASQIKNLVKDELKDRNQQDHSPSFTGSTSIHEESSTKITLDDKEPVIDKVAANKNKILYDPSIQKGRS